MSSFKNIRHKNGFTLIEIILVIGFILLASVIVYNIYNKIIENSMVSSETQNMKRILTEIQPSISSGSKINLSPYFLAAAGIIKKENIIHDNYINKIGSETSLSSLYAYNTDRVTHLKVVYPHMNNIFCAKLINSYEPYADFISVGIYVLKNKLDPDNLVNYQIDTAFNACEKVSTVNNDFPMILSLKIGQ